MRPFASLSVCLCVCLSVRPFPDHQTPGWQQWSECLPSPFLANLCPPQAEASPRGRLWPDRHSQTLPARERRRPKSKPVWASNSEGSVGRGWEKEREERRVRESCQCIISTITQLLHRLSICEMREDSLVTFQFPRFTHHRRRSGNSRGGNVVGVSFASSCASSPYLVVSPRCLTYRVQTTAVPHFACPSHICGGGGRELCVQSQHSTYMCGRLKTK